MTGEDEMVIVSLLLSTNRVKSVEIFTSGRREQVCRAWHHHWREGGGGSWFCHDRKPKKEVVL